MNIAQLKEAAFFPRIMRVSQHILFIALFSLILTSCTEQEKIIVVRKTTPGAGAWILWPVTAIISMFEGEKEAALKHISAVKVFCSRGGLKYFRTWANENARAVDFVRADGREELFFRCPEYGPYKCTWRVRLDGVYLRALNGGTNFDGLPIGPCIAPPR